jgi:membrane-associated phospholipid phosphatase
MAQTCIVPGTCITLFVFGLAAYAQNVQTPGTDDKGQTQRDARDRNLYGSDNAADRSTTRKLISNVWLDQKDIWTSPFTMHRSNAKWWVLVGAGTGALIATDHTISKQLTDSGTSIHVGTAVSRAGQFYAVYPFAAGLYGLGLASGNPRLQRTGALAVQALLDADIVFNVLKLASGRDRPLEGDRGGHFGRASFSFPSGHAAQAWALAAVVATEYRDHRWVPLLAYTYATAVSASRVVARQHFPADAFMGSAIGFLIGRYVVKTENTHLGHSRQDTSKFLRPIMGPYIDGGKTITVTLGWRCK